MQYSTYKIQYLMQMREAIADFSLFERRPLFSFSRDIAVWRAISAGFFTLSLYTVFFLKGMH